MLSFQNLSLRRGSNLLFADVNFTIHKKSKVGLVGANGSGKSSLLKLIKKEIESDHGELHIPPNLRIACLDQEIPSSEEIALDYVLEGDIDLSEVDRDIKIAEENGNYQILGELHTKFEDLGFRLNRRTSLKYSPKYHCSKIKAYLLCLDIFVLYLVRYFQFAQLHLNYFQGSVDSQR